MFIRVTQLLVVTIVSLSLGTSYALGSGPVAPPLPEIPANVFKITDYGAVGDGKTENTAAIQKTVDACNAAGGGTVQVPAGTFLTGPFALASKMRLQVEKDAVVRIDNDISTYPKGGKGFANSITANEAHDIEISGAGTIDGQGEPWWKAFRADKTGFPHRPCMIVLTGCTRVLVKDITLINSPSFHLVPAHCTDVTIDHVTITAPADAPNTDALDPSGWNHLITHCTFDVGDDDIAVKASGTATASKLSCEDFTITDCTFLHGHGLSIGGQTSGGLRRMRVSNCTFDGTTSGIRMKASRGEGGVVAEVHYFHITMKNVGTPVFITSYYPKGPKNPADDPAQPANTAGPVWEYITISDLTATGSQNAGIIWGLPELPVSNLTFSHVDISAKDGMKIYNAQAIRFFESKITVEKGDKVMLYNAQPSGL